MIDGLFQAVPMGFLSFGPQEMLIVGIIAVLLFGGRLPEVGRSLGKSLMEFKKGLRGLEDELNAATNPRSSSSSYSSRGTRSTATTPEQDDRAEATAPKFEPPASAPQPEHSAESTSA